MHNYDVINPQEEYPFAVARQFFPGQRGQPLSLGTLHRWRARGLFAAQARTVGRKTFWYVRGEELIRLRQRIVRDVPAAAPAPGHEPRPATDKHRQAVEYLRSQGLNPS